MNQVDFIVVGSGATGAMAAQTLVDGGASVLLLDGGNTDRSSQRPIPDTNFLDIRQNDEEQYRIFLGSTFESIASASVGTGSQLTPSRQFITEGVDRFLPLRSDNFKPLESLALGGLGSGWGLGCCVFSDSELTRASLPIDEMRSAYQVVADRIGICGMPDDARRYTTAHLDNIQPSPPIDDTAAYLYNRYHARRSYFRDKGFYAGRPGLALLTQDRDERRGSQLNDMEFYTDSGLSAWRPWIAIERLQKNALFQYQGGVLVTQFSEAEDEVRVRALDMGTNQAREFVGRRLVLTAGALGTARIVLRSLNVSPATNLPLLCNPYTYLPCVVPPRFGKAMRKDNISLCQLALFHDPDGSNTDVAMGFVYSYRALMMFRLIQQAPLDFQSGRILMQYFMSGLLIVGVHHPHADGAENVLRLEPDSQSPTGDRLFVDFRLSDGAQRAIAAREGMFVSALRNMGAHVVKRVHPGFGSSIHYAGTLPVDSAGPLGTSNDGQLTGTRRVFVADGSSFTYLPAKGLTLSLMANAHRIASRLVRTN